MAISKGRNGDEGKPAEVNIAPLIDVTFLLIVFFMSIWQASHIEVKAELLLPEATQGNPELQRDRDRLIVNIDKDGDIYVSNMRYSIEDLSTLLAREAERSRGEDGFAERPVFIRADGDLPFGDVQAVMMICRDWRIWRLALRTRKPEEE